MAGTALAQAPVTVTIESEPSGTVIPADFTGLSFETLTVLPDRQGGHFFSATNAPLVTLFRNLGLKSLRVGGATVDMAKVADPHPADLDALFGFARAAGVKVIYSLRLLNSSPKADAELASYIWSHYRTELECFAVGNEPDWPFYHKQDPSITNYTSYLARWQSFATALTQAVPEAGFCGPDTGGNLRTGPPERGPGPAWTTGFAEAVAGAHRLTVVTQHHYVGENAGRLSAAQGMEGMLSANWNAYSNQALYAAMAEPIVREGLHYRFTEANDFAGGVTNASNAFASALWALDFLHWWAAHGASGVNFHNKRWIPTATILPGTHGQLVCAPRGYALKAFALGSQGRVQPLTLTETNRLNLTAYAVANETNLLVTLINKEHGPGARSAAVTLVPRGVSAGEVACLFLTAPKGDVGATAGITLGGLAITNNARWRANWLTLGAVTNGQCTLRLGPASASVVRIVTKGVGL